VDERCRGEDDGGRSRGKDDGATIDASATTVAECAPC